MMITVTPRMIEYVAASDSRRTLLRNDFALRVRIEIDRLPAAVSAAVSAADVPTVPERSWGAQLGADSCGLAGGIVCCGATG